jgi:hypothetical protein
LSLTFAVAQKRLSVEELGQSSRASRRSGQLPFGRQTMSTACSFCCRPGGSARSAAGRGWPSRLGLRRLAPRQPPPAAGLSRLALAVSLVPWSWDNPMSRPAVCRPPDPQTPAQEAPGARAGAAARAPVSVPYVGWSAAVVARTCGLPHVPNRMGPNSSQGVNLAATSARAIPAREIGSGRRLISRRTWRALSRER